MSSLRGRRAVALSLALSALVASCSKVPDELYALEPSEEPLCDREPRELDGDDSCRWLDDGRLFVETVSGGLGGMRSITQVWIRFRPPSRPQLEAASWNEDSFTRWPHGWMEGRSWVSSDGVGSGATGVAGLTIDMQYTVLDSGSPLRCCWRLFLSADALARGSG